MWGSGCGHGLDVEPRVRVHKKKPIQVVPYRLRLSVRALAARVACRDFGLNNRL
jgi:hypothetical protein